MNPECDATNYHSHPHLYLPLIILIQLMGIHKLKRKSGVVSGKSVLIVIDILLCTSF